MSKIWNAITGYSACLCYFMSLTEIAQRGSKKQLDGNGTKYLGLPPSFEEAGLKQGMGCFSAGLITAVANVSFIKLLKMLQVCRGLRLTTLAAALVGLAGCLAIPAKGQGTQPLVAIHDSELTRALETMPASGATPAGTGTTSNQWWITQWHYFVMPDSVKEMLRSDGTAFTVVGDSNIVAGVLTNADGSPKYPIVISLAAEAIQDAEIANLTNYVAAGGFLFVGSSSFTRNTNGTTRGDFAIANAMGVDMVNPALTNWSLDGTFTKISNHPILSLLPAGQVEWQMASSSEEISWPVYTRFNSETPNAANPGLPHLVWQVQANGATVIAQGDGSLPYLSVKPYGKGCFIYDAALQPLIGHGGWAPGMYAYSIFRNAIQWAFQSAGLPVVKRSPWPYAYNAAVIFRHDMEAIPANITGIEGSALFEHTNGASGDYYFCTGTLRQDMPNPTLTNTIASLRRAIANDGATINSHNGGLTNINPYYVTNIPPSPLVVIEANLGQLISEGWLTAFEPYTDPVLAPFPSNGLEYDYWHWSPDEILDLTNGSAYALTSISNSFVDLAGWQLTNGTPRAWVAPYFNATREGSFQIEQQLGIKIAGETKLSPFPHWTLSAQAPDKLYPTLQLPVSDWFVPSPLNPNVTQIAQAMEANHTTASVQALVDAYYNLGALINLYCHSASPSGGPAGSLPGTYLTYSLSKPRIWSTNSAGIYAWWLQESNAQVAVNYTNISGQSVTTLSITGEGNPNAAVEVLAPSASYSALQVFTNGALAGTDVYRTNGQLIKVLVGTSVSNAVIRYLIPPSAQDDVFTGPQGSSLVVSAPGVLTNDTAGSGGGGLTAMLVSGPANGSLTLNSDGSFTYMPTGNFAGADGFSYQAVSGSLTSSVATVTIMVLSPGELVYDTFGRETNAGDIFPWVQELGTWSITNSALVGTSPLNSYGYAYYDDSASWNNFSVQAQIQFSSTSGLGGGVGGRLDPVSGAHYAAWIYPENSSAGPGTGTAVLQLVKFETWTAYTLIGNPITLPGMGTNPHTVQLTFQTNSLAVYFDGVLETNITDDGSIDGLPAYTNGTVSLDMYTDSSAYTMSVDNVIVSTLATIANNDSYNAAKNTALHVPAPGVLVNDSGGSGSLTVFQISVPSHGSLTLTNNGGFTYTPSNNFTGVDSFTYEATDGQTTSGVATVTITVNNFPVANNDSYAVAENATLTVGPPGILANDTGGSGPLSAIFVTGPTQGTLSPTNNGSFGYTPGNNFIGSDSFTYRATDGVATSDVATVTITVTPPTTANNDIYGMTPGTTLNVSTPGVLANDVSGGGSLTALSASAPLHGILNLANSGGFAYQPTNNFIGIDDFTYQASDGVTTSAVAAVAVEVTPAGKLLVDNFSRSLLWPWAQESGAWSLANNALLGTGGANSYAYAYISNNWTDYIVQGQIQTSSTNAWGFGLSGHVDPTTGAQYAAWVYPEGSQGPNYPPTIGTTGTAVLKLIRFTAWNAYTVLGQVNLPNVGNNWHTVKMAFQGTNIVVSYDGTQEINTNDPAPFISGGISAGMYLDSTVYTLSVSNVVVAPLVADDSYTVGANTTLNVASPGVLTNDTDLYGAGLTAALVSGPAHGILNLTNNGGFSYTPTNSFAGTDSFVYSANSGATNLGNATVTITVIPLLTVTADNLTRAYGTTNPAFAVSYNGFVNGDTTNVLTGAPNITTAATTNSPVGGYTITISQGTLSAPNYNFAFVNGTLTVTQAVLAVSSGISANNKVYDRTAVATITSNNVSLNGVVAGDVVNLSTNGYTATFASTNVGTGIAVNVSGLSLTGARATNYTLNLPLVLNANITGKALTVASGLSANNKVYDRTAVATITSNNVSLNGVVAGDVVNLSTNGYTATFASTNVGTGIAVNVSGLSLTGARATNYTLNLPLVLNANITGKALTVASGLSANNKVYDRTAVATITSNNVSLNGVVAGDVVNLSTNGYTATFASTNVGTGIAVNVSGLSLTGARATNYTLNLPLVLNANITAVGLTLTASNQAKVYGQTLTFNGTEFGVSGLVGGDSVSSASLSSAGAVAGAAVGGSPYSIVITNAVGVGLTNYTISYVNGALTVNAALLGVSANNTNRAYGTTNPVFTVSYNGFVNGDSLNVLSGAPVLTTSAATNSPVGTYVITNSAGTLVATNYLVSLTNGLLTVNAGNLTLTASNQAKVYGQTLTFNGTEFGVSGLVGGDSVSSASLSSAGAAAGAAVGGSPYSIVITNAVGVGLTNYTISYVNGALTVNAALLGVSANNTNRAYGTTNPVFTVSYNGFVNGDSLNVLSGAPVLTTSAATNSPVGSYVITNSAGTLVATNYLVSLTNGLLTVNAGNLTLTASNQAKVYGQTLSFAGTEFGVSGLVGGDSVSSASLSSAGAAAGAAVGGSPYSIVITNAVGVGLTNYTISYVNGALTVNAALLGVSANNTNRAYGTTNPVFTVSYNGFVNGDSLNVLSGAPVLTTSAATNSPVGSYVITNTLGTLVATNYLVSLTNGLLTVNAGNLTLTASNQAKVYGQTLTFNGTEFGVSGLVGGDSVSSASLSSAGAVAGAAVGGSPYSIVITNAVGVGLTNYTISYVNGALTVNAALLGVSANNTNRAYGTTNPVFTVSYNGFVNGDSLNVLSGAPVLTTSAATNSPVGTYVITNSAGTLVATNYLVSLTNGLLTVNAGNLTLTASNQAKVYGQTLTFNGTEFGVSGLVGGDSVSSASLSSAGAAAGAAVGGSPYSIVITNAVGVGLTNYTISYVNGALTVNAALLGVSANNTNRAYGTTNPVFTVSYNGFVNGDSLNVLSGAPVLTTSAATNSPVGSYVITNSAGTLVATNYLVSLTNGLLTVNAGNLTLTASNQAKVYGQTLSFAGTEFGVSGLVGGDSVSSASLSSAGAAAGAAVGGSPYSIVITNAVGVGLTNYTISYVNGALTVNAALLGVSANNTNRAYGTTNPVFTVSYNGFVNGDSLNVLSGAPVLTTSAATNSPVGSYVITNTLGTLVATNYLVSLTNGLLTVNAGNLTLTASNQAKVYGQTLTFNGTEFGVSGLVGGDSVSSASLSSAGAAAGAAVGGSPYSIVITNAVGVGLTNYTISYVNGALTVNAALLGVSANNTNRAYGTTNPVFTVSYNGFVNGDSLNVLSGAPVLTTSAATNSPVGSYVITNTLGTLVATNYLVSLTNGLLTVNAGNLTLTASNQAKVYGQTLSFAGTEFGVSGLVGGDSVSSASLSSAGAAAGAAVGGSPYSIVITNAVGVGLTNYTISYVNGALTVNAALLGVSANNTNRAYGTTNPVFTVSYNGFVNGDSLNVLSGAPVLTTSAATNSPVGTYVITNSAGTLVATNYLVSLTNGLLTVNAGNLTLTASNQAKVYGQTLSFAGTEFGVSGLVGGDSVSSASLSSAGAAAGAAVGGSPYSIVITNAVGVGLTNYTISYVNGALTVNAALLGVSANNTNRAYGTTNPVFTVSYNGFVNGDSLNVLSGAPVLTTSAATNSPVGTYVITNSAGTLVATNYLVSLTNGLLTVNAGNLTLTASNQAKVYGQTLTFNGTEFGVSGLVGGDSVSSASLSSAGAAAGAAVGGSPYSIVITNAVGVGLTNYTISYVNGALTVNAALLGVSANNTNRAYGTTNPVFTVSYNGFVNGDSLNVLSGAPVLTTSAATNSPVGTYVITNSAGTLVATNYLVSLTNGLLTVNAGNLTLTASNQAKVYGQTLSFAGTEFGVSGLVGGDSVSSASLSSAGAAAGAAVGGSPYSIVITNAVGVGLTNYTISYVNGALTVNAALLGVSANNTNRAYGTTNPVFTVSYNGFVNGDSLNVLSGAPVLTTSAATNSPVGTYVITNSAGTLVATNYLVSLTNGLLTVNAGNLTLTASNQAKVYGQTLSFAGTEFGVSGLVGGDSVSSASLSSAGAAAGAAVGGSPYSIVITNAVGVGLTNYTISYVNGALTVNAALLGVSANNTNRAYGTTNPVFTVSYNGFVNGDSLNVLSGAPVLTTSAATNSPVGTYVITNSAGTLVATNYLVSLTNGVLTVNAGNLTLTASNQAKVYGQTLTFNGTEFGVSGLVGGDSVSSASLSSAGAAAGAAVGGSPYSIVITNAVGVGLTNYTISYVNGALTVNAALLGVSANNTNRAYGTTNPVFTVSYNGFVNGDSLNVLSGAPVLTTSAATNSPVGSYVITNTLGTLVATNYLVSLTNGLLTVNAGNLTLTASNQAKVYGQTLTFNGTEFGVSGLVGGDSVSSASLSSAGAAAGAAVGGSPYSIVITNAVGVGLTNYTISYVNGALTVNAALLGVSANNTNRAYGTTNPVFTVSYNGFVNGDSLNVLSGAPVLTTSAATNSPVGSYVITNTLGTLVATNYLVSLTNGVLTVTGAVLTATVNTGITANNKVYDGTTVASISLTNLTLTGIVSGDTVSLSTNGYTANFAGAGVGTNIPVTVSGLTLSGSVASNYTLVQPVILTANITPKALTVGSAAAPPVITSIRLTNGVVTIAWNSATGGIYRVQYKDSLNGGGWNNLSPDVTATGSMATQTNAVGSTPQRFYRVNLLNMGLSANDKVYDGTTAATISSNNVMLVGVVNGDSVSLVTIGYTANFATAAVGNGIPVSVSGLTLSGASAGNYTLTQPTGLTANITGKVLTILSVPPPVITSIGFTNGVVTITWNSVSGGVYRVQYINNLNGHGWTNLSPDVTATNLTATKTDAAGSVSQRFYRIEVLNSGITANNKIYDGTTVATIASNNVVLVGILGGDTVGLSTNGYTATFANPNTGMAIPVTVSGLVLTGANAADYTLAPLVGLTANITPATLTVSAVNVSRTYGLPNPPFTVSYGGFVNAEGTNVLTGAPSLITSAAINSPPGPYTITVSTGTLSANNYGFTFVNGMLTVLASPVLSGVPLSPSQFALTWPTITNQTYQLEYATNLAAATWTPLGTPVVGSGNPVIVTNGLDALPQRFFRLRISP